MPSDPDLSYWTLTRSPEGVVTARFEHPPMNYFCAGAAEELAGLIARWAEDAVRAVVITGARNGAFITHYSVEELAQLAGDPVALDAIGTDLNDGYHALLASLRALGKPVIAAINGDCMGGGFELALWCDLRIAQAGDHRIGLPEVRLGIIPGGSGTQMLSRIIGLGPALGLILTGSVVDPMRALDLGLVHEVADDALARAQAIAGDLAMLNPVALAMTKAAVLAGHDETLTSGLAAEGRAFLETMRSKAAVAVIQAYLAEPVKRRRAFLEGISGPASQ
ncbi:enoyl-CoA hydratase-related protein [soil metagenome]